MAKLEHEVGVGLSVMLNVRKLIKCTVGKSSIVMKVRW